MLSVVDLPPDRGDWLRNGSFVLRSPTARGASTRQRFGPRDFCADRYHDGNVWRRVFLLCPCERHPVSCISKCCRFGHALNCEGAHCKCEPFKKQWLAFHNSNQLPDNGSDVTYEILEGNEPTCPNGKRLWHDNPLYRPEHITHPWFKYPHGKLFNYTENCGDYIIRTRDSAHYTIGYCFRTEPFEGVFQIGSILHIPATLLLALTLLVLLTVPEKPVSAHGFVHCTALKCHVFALLLSNLILALYDLSADTTAFCRTSPFVMYFALVAAALWLNAMCINMGCAFRQLSGPRSDGRKRGPRLFLHYSVYAWGSAAAMTSFSIAMWYAEAVPQGWLRPTLMESRRCFWEDEEHVLQKTATFAYFYGPVTALLLVNASIFVFITLAVRQVTKHTTAITRPDNDSRSTAETQRSALLYVKLLWLMGVAEMAVEIGAWAAHSGGFYYLMAADVIDLLRAVSIFALCVCKRRTLRALHDRLRRRAGGGGGGGGGGAKANTRRGAGAPRAELELAERRGQRAPSVERTSSGTSVTSVCHSTQAAA